MDGTDGFRLRDGSMLSDHLAVYTKDHCGAWKPETHLDRGPVDCGCGWGQLCEYSDNPLTQRCRDCGQPFPYDPEADRCPTCIAAQIPA